MFRLGWILLPLATGRLRTGARNAKRRAVLLAFAGLAALIAFVFALIAITVLLAEYLGTLGALGVVGGTAALIALILLAVLKRGDRVYREQASLLSQVPPGAYSSSLMRALSGARRPRAGRALGLGMLALGALLVVLQSGDDDADA